MNIAVIPARGGSKRIPRKNIKDFLGKPMISWSINAALESGCFERVIVSTDDEEIAGIAKQLGAEVPFMRPEYLSNDHAETIPVIAHATQWLIDNSDMPQWVCCIYATAPFIEPEDLKQALKLAKENQSDFSFSAAVFPSPVQRSFFINENQRVQMFYPENFDKRSQDLVPAYHDAGQFYWGKTDAWLSGKPIFGEYSAPFILPSYRVQDIDTMEDWIRAELMFKVLSAIKE